VPSRRRFLAAGATVGLGLAGGCLSDSVGVPEPPCDDESERPPESASIDPRRGEAGAVDATLSYDGSEYTYDPESDTVSDGDDREPFDEWAAVGTRNVARRRVDKRVRNALPDADSLAVLVSGENDSLRLVATVTTRLDRGGCVVSEPEIEYDALRDATPRSATATVKIADQSATETFPVFASARVVKLD